MTATYTLSLDLGTRRPVATGPQPSISTSGAAADDIADAADAVAPERNTLVVANPALRSGFVQFPRTILHAKDLSRDAKLLYGVLLSYAWQEGSCFPGYERLKDDLHCGINQVTRYLQELQRAGLITQRRRGQGKTNAYTLQDLPTSDKSDPPPPDQPPGESQSAESHHHQSGESGLTAASQSHRFGDARITESVNLVSPKRRPKQDSEDLDPEEQQHPAPGWARLAPTGAMDAEQHASASAVVALLVAQGITRSVARELAMAHDQEAIQQQVAWQALRPTVKNPPGALVKAIRERWAPPPAWLERQQRDAAAARQAAEAAARTAEVAAERRQREALPPEERVQGHLEFWLMGQRRRGREPAATEIAAKQAELITQLTAPPLPLARAA